MLSFHHIISGYDRPLLQEAFSGTLEKGRLVALLGRNGCGKTTLIHTTVGFVAPLEGQIRIDNRPVGTLSIKERAKLMSIVGTKAVQSPYMCVYDLIALGRYPYLSFMGRLQDKDRVFIEEIVQVLGIEHLQYKRISSCSDGEQQLVQLARALAQDTPIILLDEATAHLDFVNKVKIFERLQALAKNQGKLILMSTHDLHIALRYADSVMLFEEGRIVCATPDYLVEKGLISRVFETEGLRFRF
jgi:iron complex transport system ATP-binding protein